MHFRRAFAVLSFGIKSVASASATQNDFDVVQGLQYRAIAARASEASGNLGGCALKQAAQRRDWEALAVQEEKEYITAVKCLLEADPVLTDFGWASKTRFDDFVAVHMNLTLSIHRTGNFLGFHRYLVWIWERALKEECGYSGYQPYWNWFKYQNDLRKSPVFDGSDTSMSGAGAFFAHNGSAAQARTVYLPSGNGGGCLKDGPFSGLTVNLGPIRPGMDGMANVSSVFNHNPRCLRRDLTAASAAYLTVEQLVNITIGDASGTIKLFQEELQSYNHPGSLGLHTAGHFAIGGDANDLFSSPNDPAFWLHHAMVDRVWWIWQSLHPAEARTVDGTVTPANDPPSRNATFDNVVTTRGLAPDVKLSETLDTLGGPFCYIYV